TEANVDAQQKGSAPKKSNNQPEITNQAPESKTLLDMEEDFDRIMQEQQEAAENARSARYEEIRMKQKKEMEEAVKAENKKSANPPANVVVPTTIDGKKILQPEKNGDTGYNIGPDALTGKVHVSTEGLQELSKEGDRIFVGYHGSKTTTDELQKNYRVPPKAKDGLGQQLGCGIYCTLDLENAQKFAGHQGSVSKVYVTPEKGKKLQVYELPKTVDYDSTKEYGGEFWVHREDPGQVAKLEKADAVTGPLIPDEGIEGRVSTQTKINPHVLEAGRVEFVPFSK
ncbi:MAG: hypothetical protein SGCHY_002535, partial [Lobulomycetales sp.]